ncbi:MAG: hypothetical protein ACLRP3_13460 [Escherichia sp.]
MNDRENKGEWGHTNWLVLNRLQQIAADLISHFEAQYRNGRQMISSP